jgi:hypothetical protein
MEDSRDWVGNMPAVEADEIRNAVCDDGRGPILLRRLRHVDRNARVAITAVIVLNSVPLREETKTYSFLALFLAILKT